MTKNNNLHKLAACKIFGKKINKFNIFLKRNKNIMFTSVYKGNSTICMSNYMHIRSEDHILSNKEIYEVVTQTKTLLTSLQKKSSKCLNHWAKQRLLMPIYLNTQIHTSIQTIISHQNFINLIQ